MHQFARRCHHARSAGGDGVSWQGDSDHACAALQPGVLSEPVRATESQGCQSLRRKIAICLRGIATICFVENRLYFIANFLPRKSAGKPTSDVDHSQEGASMPSGGSILRSEPGLEFTDEAATPVRPARPWAAGTSNLMAGEWSSKTHQPRSAGSETGPYRPWRPTFQPLAALP